MESVEALAVWGLAKFNAGSPDEGLEALGRAAAIRRERGLGSNWIGDIAIDGLARTLRQTGRADEAERLLEEDYRGLKALLGENNSATQRALRRLGATHLSADASDRN